MDPFLSRMATSHSGRVWKAASAEELLPVFQAFSSTLLHRYVVSYRFLEAPNGSLAFGVPELTIEEVTTIDSAPLLNQVYFETGQSELPDRYELLTSQIETEAFDEKKLKGPMQKYQNLLNIIGRRMRNTPDATILLVGCNSNIGAEKNRTDLSRSRAESVKAYLRYVWGIDPKRISIEQRNLPEMPSTNRIPEGQAENQRVEIYADNEAILDTVDSAYIEKVSNLEQLKIVPDIKSEAGITEYQVDLFCGNKEIKTIKGQGDLPREWSVQLQAALLEEISDCRSVEMQMQATDKEANEIGELETGILPVNFVQRTQQMAKVQGYKVKEQYALILFDYDSAAIKAHNQTIMERIIGRIQQLPDAAVSIIGHTDSIGSQEYNMDLSSRRSEAAKLSILEAAADLNDRMQVSGVGPNDPLYDNQLPEGRALNRTVTITLEYTQN
jgi:outer membrane protein OmpA-like peptidoglycan-associated protein